MRINWHFSQTAILERLALGRARWYDYKLADNITRARYADLLWSDKGYRYRCHFMFHTDKQFNGFGDGERYISRHTLAWNLWHCCWCTCSPECSDHLNDYLSHDTKL